VAEVVFLVWLPRRQQLDALLRLAVDSAIVTNSSLTMDTNVHTCHSQMNEMKHF